MGLREDVKRIASHARTYLGELETNEISVMGSRASLLEAGSNAKDLILFLHGVAVSKSCWRTVMQRLYSQYHTVAIDLPGYNYTKEFSPNNYSIQTQAQWVQEHTKHLSKKRIHVVGHSVGAGVAAYFAAAFPERTASLTLINYPELFCDLDFAPEKAEQELSHLWAESVDDFQKLLATFFHTPPQIPEILIKSYIKKLSGKRNRFDKLVSDTCKSIPHLHARIPQIKAPTLLISGDCDKFSPTTVLERLKQAIPQAQTTIIPKAGHLSLLERPNEISSELEIFLHTQQ